ncbi:MAG: hypothetical protein QOF66_662 [Mycobacterium sp.]|nr:hypothetical protein [Mycobacterium sp.]
MLLAVTFSAVGFAFDAGSGDKNLSLVFAASYALGCIFAVLAVRQSGIFTAVIQPPLILFVAVPTSYFLFHGAHFTGIKDTLINFGYPLIERFPLMFFTAAAVLLIGMGRWYYGMSSRRAAARSTANETTSSSRVSSVTSKLSSLLTGGAGSDSDDADGSDGEDTVDAAESPRRRHTIERPSRAAKPAAATARSGRTAKRATPSRSRHARPPETEIIEPVAERPRRPRTPRQSEQPPMPPAEPRRRPRSSTREPRKAVPPGDRRAAYERPERRRRLDDYQPLEPPGSNGNGTHHPVSRVRYRGDADENDNHAEHRTRPRSARDSREADSWEYDI